MRNSNFLFFTLFIITASFAQKTSEEFKYKATYKLTFQSDSTNTESRQTENMLLYLGDKISHFGSEGSIIKDSLMSNRDPNNKSMAALGKIQAQIPPTKFNYHIYKKLDQNTLIFAEKIVKTKYLYKEALNQINWEILPETKTLHDYKLQKATCNFAGRKYTAWFAPEIPIPDGPYKFNGLPGLIMEITDQKDHYSFELVSLKTLKTPVNHEFEIEDYLEISQKELEKVSENYDRDPIGAVEEAGITFGFAPGQREKMHQEHLKELKKKNNPIELEIELKN